MNLTWVIAMKVIITALLCTSVFALAACSREFSQEPEKVSVRDLTASESAVKRASENFGFTLLQQLHEEAQDDNIFISPLSVSMALGMTLNGANGDTETAMRSTLNMADMSQQQINEAYASLIELLTTIDPKVQFEIANSIWSRLGFEVEPDFIDINKTYFDAEVQTLDFGSSQAPQTINAWVNDKTNGKIEKIIDSIPPDLMMYLINAIYFKGTWMYEFDTAETREKPFYISEGEPIQTDMMIQTNDSFPYFETEEMQAIDLPYGNGQFRMSVFLPRSGVSVNDIVARLNGDVWQEWTQKFAVRRGTLELPKFKLEYKKMLNSALADMGMGIAFGREADFTGINKKGNLLISEVLHKTFVEVNEEGTEAAAVTSVGVALTSVDGPKPGFVMSVNRPFFFVIREKSSGTILFMGKIINPEA